MSPTSIPAYYDVESLAQLKAFTDPLRLRVLSILMKHEATNRQISRELEEPQAKILHHIRMLLDVGLITLVRSEVKGGNVEKYYRSIARQFLLHTGRELDQETRAGLSVALSERIRSEMLRAAEKYPDIPASVFRKASVLTDERLREFQERLCTLIEEYWPLATPEQEGTSLRFAAFVYRDTDFFHVEDDGSMD